MIANALTFTGRALEKRRKRPSGSVLCWAEVFFVLSLQPDGTRATLGSGLLPRPLPRLWAIWAHIHLCPPFSVLFLCLPVALSTLYEQYFLVYSMQ